VKLVHPKATFEQTGLPVAAAIDDDKSTAWAVDPQFGKNHAAVFETETDIGFDGGTVLTFTLDFKNNKQHAIGRPRLSLSTAPRPVDFDGTQLPQSIEAILGLLDDDAKGRLTLTADQRAVLVRWYRTIDPGWIELHQAIEQHSQTAPKPETVKVLISSEGVP